LKKKLKAYLMKNFLVLFFYLFSMPLFSQVGFLCSTGGVWKFDNAASFSYELGIYGEIGKNYFFASYGSEKYSFLKAGCGGKVSNVVRADFAFVFYANAGFYGDVLPKHFGGTTTFYFNSRLSPYIRASLTTFAPALEAGVRYGIPFIE